MKYQIGGSLHSGDPIYVVRPADEQLYDALKAGAFCYVLNSRQTGKTSLLQSTSSRLQKEDCVCVYLDMTTLCSEVITPVQWYRGMITVLYYRLNLTRHINLRHWWEQQCDRSPVQQLHQFIEDVVLPHVRGKPIFIFVDEIDNLLNLRFSVSDFFAWIQSCYRQRPHYSNFNHLNFVLSGVATPSNLMADTARSPFSIGTAIELSGFQFHEAAPLLNGLQPYINQPEAILQEILHWTNGQPFLTQKLCQRVVETVEKATPAKLNLSLGTEIFWIEDLVQSSVIQNWETQDEPEHLRTIRDRLLGNEQRAEQLLQIYLQLLEVEQARVPFDGSSAQVDLLLSGLVEKHRGYLKINNPIYRAVFNAEWVSKQLGNPDWKRTENNKAVMQ